MKKAAAEKPSELQGGVKQDHAGESEPEPEPEPEQSDAEYEATIAAIERKAPTEKLCAVGVSSTQHGVALAFEEIADYHPRRMLFKIPPEVVHRHDELTGMIETADADARRAAAWQIMESELTRLRLPDLRARAAEEGHTAQEIDEAALTETPKQSLVEMIVAQWKDEVNAWEAQMQRDEEADMQVAEEAAERSEHYDGQQLQQLVEERRRRSGVGGAAWQSFDDERRDDALLEDALRRANPKPVLVQLLTHDDIKPPDQDDAIVDEGAVLRFEYSPFDELNGYFKFSPLGDKNRKPRFCKIGNEKVEIYWSSAAAMQNRTTSTMHIKGSWWVKHPTLRWSLRCSTTDQSSSDGLPPCGGWQKHGSGLKKLRPPVPAPRLTWLVTKDEREQRSEASRNPSVHLPRKLSHHPRPAWPHTDKTEDAAATATARILSRPVHVKMQRGLEAEVVHTTCQYAARDHDDSRSRITVVRDAKRDSALQVLKDELLLLPVEDLQIRALGEGYSAQQIEDESEDSLVAMILARRQRKADAQASFPASHNPAAHSPRKLSHHSHPASSPASDSAGPSPHDLSQHYTGSRMEVCWREAEGHVVTPRSPRSPRSPRTPRRSKQEGRFSDNEVNPSPASLKQIRQLRSELHQLSMPELYECAINGTSCLSGNRLVSTSLSLSFPGCGKERIDMALLQTKSPTTTSQTESPTKSSITSRSARKAKKAVVCNSFDQDTGPKQSLIDLIVKSVEDTARKQARAEVAKLEAEMAAAAQETFLRKHFDTWEVHELVDEARNAHTIDDVLVEHALGQANATVVKARLVGLLSLHLSAPSVAEAAQASGSRCSEELGQAIAVMAEQRAVLKAQYDDTDVPELVRLARRSPGLTDAVVDDVLAHTGRDDYTKPLLVQLLFADAVSQQKQQTYQKQHQQQQHHHQQQQQQQQSQQDQAHKQTEQPPHAEQSSPRTSRSPTSPRTPRSQKLAAARLSGGASVADA